MGQNINDVILSNNEKTLNMIKSVLETDESSDVKLQSIRVIQRENEYSNRVIVSNKVDSIIKGLENPIIFGTILVKGDENSNVTLGLQH